MRKKTLHFVRLDGKIPDGDWASELSNFVAYCPELDQVGYLYKYTNWNKGVVEPSFLIADHPFNRSEFTYEKINWVEIKHEEE